ncbi:MAG: hypothetical protein IGR92_12155 [Leptolyngbyaceae cyanobacterium T60_A2020_046]|nr:hypothetical protein [Leptolyngbyaceae cyanobacterium T60_A2020_046]
MRLPQKYVLILDEQQRWLGGADFPLASASLCDIFVAASAEQALEKARQTTPCLVILVGSDLTWVKTQVHALRGSTGKTEVTIVALTESSHPNWEPHDDTPDVDGFLVKPLTDDVLTSLVQSAIAKQSYQHAPLPPPYPTSYAYYSPS